MVRKINERVAEIVGIYIGDGYIYRGKGKYQIGFVGSPKTDVELFEKLKRLIKSEFNKNVKFKIRAGGLRMVFRSREICNLLIKDLELPFGMGKCERVKIPDTIFNDWNLVKYTIRGIMDTDGSIFVSKKPGIEKYPSIEITTTSITLANQLKEILSKHGFRVTNIREYFPRLGKRMSYKVALYGRINIKKWLKEIGFSNEYKRKRALDYIQ